MQPARKVRRVLLARRKAAPLEGLRKWPRGTRASSPYPRSRVQGVTRRVKPREIRTIYGNFTGGVHAGSVIALWVANWRRQIQKVGVVKADHGDPC